MEILICLAIGILAGFSGGLFGIGGGIVIVPALALAFGYSQQKAQGTSLVALLAPVGLLALMEYYRKGDADLKVGALVALGFFVGAVGGARLALHLDEVVMRKGFAVFLVVIAAYLFFKK